MRKEDVDFARAVVLVSCVKTKRNSSAPARDLYQSGWFRKARAFVEGNDARWFILSAKHGLLCPDAITEPYELTLNTMSVTERRVWADTVLRMLIPALEGDRRVILLAGKRYRQFLTEPLTTMGIEVVAPMKELTSGRQLQWLG